MRLFSPPAFARWLLLAVMVGMGSACSGLKTAHQADADKEKGAVTYELREVGFTPTPVFARLKRSGESRGEPSRYLEKGTQVRLISVEESDLFSLIEIEEGERGYVPSRLVKKTVGFVTVHQGEEEESSEETDEPEESETPEPKEEAPTPVEKEEPASTTPVEVPNLPDFDPDDLKLRKPELAPLPPDD